MNQEALQQAIGKQNDNLSKLQQLLEQELHLISTRDAESLMTLLKEKEQHLEAIQQLDQQISSSYQALFSAEDEIPPAIQQAVDEARENLEQCRFRTEINQKAVEQGQLKLEHLRQLIIDTRAKESLTYDKAGKPRGGTLGRGVKA